MINVEVKETESPKDYTHLADIIVRAPSHIPQLSLYLLLQLKESSKTDSAIQEGTALMPRGILPSARYACWARSPTRCSPWRSWPPPPGAASIPGGRGWSRRRATASGERGRLQSAIHLAWGHIYITSSKGWDA